MANSDGYNVGVLGATGVVGRLLLDILEERAFPVKELRPLASANSKGKAVAFAGKELGVVETTEDSFADLDILFASAATGANRHFSPIAARAGVTVIDDSSAFRMDPDVPLVIAGVNDDDLAWHNGIVAGPNCTTMQLVIAINPIHQVNPIRRMVVDTYQAVSGWGRDAVVELDEQIKAKAAGNGDSLPREIFRHDILGNVLPEVDSFLDDGYTKEEWKVMHETRRILHEPEMKITCTAVRVPVAVSHSEAVHLELTRPMTAAEVRDVLSGTPDVRVVDDPSQGLYPVATDAAGTDDVLVGRIRSDVSHENGVAMWIVADNLRCGAATNAVRTAELLIQGDLLHGAALPTASRSVG
ncbi:MAG: aspartate-semialdehyde dehydrogenase [Chloroflexi bacterium]|nr:aspartate-semialdehyde dehydrogenase [Chloroflexota bacterium]